MHKIIDKIPSSFSPNTTFFNVVEIKFKAEKYYARNSFKINNNTNKLLKRNC